MSHISSIGAGIYSDLSISVPTTRPSAADLAGYDTAGEFQELFADAVLSSGSKGAGTYIRVQNVREFPAMGTPPNVVNVATYGQKSSQQIQGQSDSPSMEIQLNYVPEDWASGTLLGDMVGDGYQYVFRFTLLNSKPVGYDTDAAGGAASMGTADNTQFYWIGKVEALQVNPQLTDANTATVTITVQSDFFGAFTTDGA
jgi:hypothetical protein